MRPPALSYTLRDILESDEDVLRSTKHWLQGLAYHGRAGALSQFIPLAIDRNAVHIGIARVTEQGGVVQFTASEGKRFLHLAPALQPDSMFKLQLCVFPELPISRSLDILRQTQTVLYQEFVTSGLVLSLAETLCPCQREHPCPYPMLVVRHFVSDATSNALERTIRHDR